MMNVQAEVKIQQAEVYRDQIWTRVCQHVKSPTAQDELHIGALVGDLANNLRSALNYTMGLFIQGKLQGAVTRQEYQDLFPNNRQPDFPWNPKEANFNRNPLVKLLKKYYPDIYRLIESQQPFKGENWLKNLMDCSNTDKHVHINTIDDSRFKGMTLMAASGRPLPIPKIMGIGNCVMFEQENNSIPVARPLPCYFEALDAFATASGWKIFILDLDDDLRLIPFVNRSITRTHQLIERFEALAS